MITLSGLVLKGSMDVKSNLMSVRMLSSRNENKLRPPKTAATLAATYSYFGLEGMSDTSFTQREHQIYDKVISTSDMKNSERIVERCEAKGLFLGDEDIGDYDCAKACNSPDYTYTYISPHSLYLAKFFARNKPGAYCLNTEINKCNTKMGAIIKTHNGWSCRPQWPQFAGGENANEIRVCNGRIADRILSSSDPKIYTDLIPDDIVPIPLSLRPDTQTVASSDTSNKQQYRFVCADEYEQHVPSSKVDDMGNAYIEATEISRLERIRNICNDLNYHGPKHNKPDFATGDCKCVETNTVKFGRIRHNQMYTSNIECSPCIAGLIDDGETSLNSNNRKYGSFNVPRRCIKIFHRNYRLVSAQSSYDDDYGQNKINKRDSSGAIFVGNQQRLLGTAPLGIDILPCGTRTLSFKGKACLNGTLNVSVGGIPSPTAFSLLSTKRVRRP